MSRGKRRRHPATRPHAAATPSADTIVTEQPNGTREWRHDGLLHRLDGPALEGSDGTLEWWNEGKRHRDDGPAIEAKEYRWWVHNGEAKHEPVDPENDGLPGGVLMWWVDGQLHRDDGPAIEHGDGLRQWFKHGVLHREGGPASEAPLEGISEWVHEGQLHRDDGPAIEATWGSQWYDHGELHREDGPAVERRDGSREWWLNGVEMSEAEHTRGLADARRARQLGPRQRFSGFADTSDADRCRRGV